MIDPFRMQKKAAFVTTSKEALKKFGSPGKKYERNE